MRPAAFRRGRKTTFFMLMAALLVFLNYKAATEASDLSMPLPENRTIFTYYASPSPLTGPDPAGTKPVGISHDDNSAGILYLDIAVPPFTTAVDVYAAYTDSIYPDVLHILMPDMNFRDLPLKGVQDVISWGIPADIGPWRTNVTGTIHESFHIDVLKSALPLGTYRLYLAVTPAGDRGRYFLWETAFDLIETVRSRVSLRNFDNCDSVVKSLKDRAVLEMERNIDVLIEAAKQGAWGCWPPPPPPSAPGSPGPVTSEASQYSTSNVQIPGVDEADFMKNDAGYIYILADGRFQIVDAWPPQESRVVSSVVIEGDPKKLFVADGKALIYSSLGPVDGSDFSGVAWINSMAPFQGMPECTYGYDCDFTGDGRKLKITVFDISDLSKPEIEREMWLDGSFINARRIGGTIHTVVLSPGVSVPGVTYSPDIEMNDCYYYDENISQTIVSALEDLKIKNRLAIENTPVTPDMLPGVTDTRYVNGSVVTKERLLSECDRFHEPLIPGGEAFLTLLTLGIDDPERLLSETIIGRPGAVFSSLDHLYIASRNSYYEYVGWMFPPFPAQETTTIHKFDLGQGISSPVYAASGVVKGKVLNQFSMDESDEYFRIATTSGHAPDPGVHSTVTVLREEGGELVQVGQVDGIAPTEDIRSARFFGDKGFLVTFKKTDPLFSIDLSVPERPRIAGELKIPGFSTYMQSMDGDHLLTIGYDAEDMGDFSLFDGILLQIFDIGDLSNPALLHKEIIGTRGTASEAAANHLAFNYFQPGDLLAIPATICEGDSGGGGYYGTMTFSGLLVYDINVLEGFSEKGRISHADHSPYGEGSMCWNWWTQSKSIVKRSIFMDDYVYSISSDKIKVGRLDNLGLDIAVVDLSAY